MVDQRSYGTTHGSEINLNGDLVNSDLTSDRRKQENYFLNVKIRKFQLLPIPLGIIPEPTGPASCCKFRAWLYFLFEEQSNHPILSHQLSIIMSQSRNTSLPVHMISISYQAK
jgi:hypothetical protein